MLFYKEKDLALCGLACVLCSKEDCPGCKARGCDKASNCSVYKCVIEKELDGCYQCSEFPCAEKMLQCTRNRAFNRYAREFGKQALLDRLRINFNNGIIYHALDGLTGDYDILETEKEIFQLLRYGRNDPYTNCPEFDTEHFHLRQVRVEDAEELLCFYGDLSEWMFNGNDWSNGIFSSNYATAEEMRKCIRSWLNEYKNKFYIRMSVIDKATGKAVGTIEVFDNLDIATGGAALHIDLSSPYETNMFVAELLGLADSEFFLFFGFKYLIVRALPNATERLAALCSAGYKLFKSEFCKDYYMKESPVKTVKEN